MSASLRLRESGSPLNTRPCALSVRPPIGAPVCAAAASSNTFSLGVLVLVLSCGAVLRRVVSGATWSAGELITDRAPLDRSAGIFQVAFSATTGISSIDAAGITTAGTGGGSARGAAATAVTTGANCAFCAAFDPNVTSRLVPVGVIAYSVFPVRSRTTRVTGAGALANCATRMRCTAPSLTASVGTATEFLTPCTSMTRRAGLSSLNAL